MEFHVKYNNDRDSFPEGNLLYYKSAYLKSHKIGQPVSFIATEGPRVFSEIVFEKSGHKAISFSKSPFGSIWLYRDLSAKDLSSFIDFFMKQLKSWGVSEVHIKAPPAFYHDTSPINDLLIKYGFKPLVKDVNHFIPIKGVLENRMHTMERRKLQKAQKSKIVCLRENSEKLPAVHGFISTCRRQQGLEINASLEELQYQFTSLPDSYFIFSAYLDGSLSATVIMNQVVEDIVYYYLPATSEAYKAMSPMVPLLHHIYNYFLDRKIRVIDLGVTSIDGVRQEGLSKFKLRMGAEETERNTWVYQSGYSIKEV